MFNELGAQIVGVSHDSVADQKLFKDGNDFDFRLLSDEDKAVSKTYGTLFPEDHEYAGYIKRISYLIDPKGTVRKSYKVRDIMGHPEEVLQDLRDGSNTEVTELSREP